MSNILNNKSVSNDSVRAREVSVILDTANIFLVGRICTVIDIVSVRNYLLKILIVERELRCTILWHLGNALFSGNDGIAI